MTKNIAKIVIAAAGSGKTKYLIEHAAEKSLQLDHHRHMAIITYTNSANREIRDRLSSKIILTPNIFVGTIHSFLIRFCIRPYASLTDVLPFHVLYRELKVESQNKDKKIRRIQESMIIKRLIDKGIVPYEQIISISKKIMNDKNISKLVARRLQYLLVDEFQDANSGQIEIIENIRKEGETDICLVGDPEQSIMSFQTKGTKPRPLEKRAIVTFQSKKKTYTTELLVQNYRSSKTIVNFINKFHYAICQNYANTEITSENPIVFIKNQDLQSIINTFNNLCDDLKMCENKPKSRFFLSYENKTFENTAEILLTGNEFKLSEIIILTSEFISQYYNWNEEKIVSMTGYDLLDFRQKCLQLISYAKEQKKITVQDFQKHMTTLFPMIEDNLLMDKNVKYYPSKDIAKYTSRIKSILDYSQNKTVKQENDRFLTIHKAKGLQADAVLVVAKTENELNKWLEIDAQKRLLEKDDKSRLGYVAFSRAREFLCFASLKPADELHEHIKSLGCKIL